MCDFSKEIKKPCVTFTRFGRKTQLLMKFLRKISKISFEKAKNALFWSIFKNFQIFFLNFIRKIEFVSIFGKVAKNRPFGKNISFPQQFVNFYRVGGAKFPVFLLAAPMKSLYVLQVFFKYIK